jgi:hypothetical protein
MPEKMSGRMSEYMPEKSQIVCQNILYIYILYIYAAMPHYTTNISRWYVKNYVKIVCKGPVFEDFLKISDQGTVSTPSVVGGFQRNRDAQNLVLGLVA